MERYGVNNPNTQRAIQYLNEFTYIREAKFRGHTIPSLGVSDSHTKDGADGVTGENPNDDSTESESDTE